MQILQEKAVASHYFTEKLNSVGILDAHNALEILKAKKNDRVGSFS